MRAMRPPASPFLAAALALLASCRAAPPRPVPAVPDRGRRAVSLEEAVGPKRARLFRARLASYRWADDGVHLEKQDRGRTLWIDPVTFEAQEVADPHAARREGLRGALEAVEGLDAKDASRAAGTARLGKGEGEPALVEVRGELYFQRSGRPALRLTRGPGKRELARMSPDGRFVAFVQEGNLHLVDTEGGLERAVTSDGGDQVLNGRLDWVYQEEVYGRGKYRGFWWSPDSSAVAFLRLAESQVRGFPVVDHLSEGLEVEMTRYPKAGDPNPTATLGVGSVGGGDPVWMDLSRYEGEEILLVRVGWSPEGDRVLFQVQNRIQSWLDLDVGDPRTGEVRNLLRETSPTWVNVLGQPRWLPDGSFLWESERTGYRHLYHYARDGRLLGPVTRGAWEVRSVLKVDGERGLVWFTSSRDGAIDGNAYRIRLDGTGLRRLTPDPGTHSIRLDASGSRFLDRFSSLETPPEVRLCDRDGGVLRVLERAKVAALEDHLYVTPERLRIPARDGFEMDATLMKPPGFDPGRRYPVWLSTYSGPNAPTVHNAWSGDAWLQFLAQQGILVLRVNNRTSSGKGQWSTAACYKRLGETELQDLEDAVRWLVGHPWADASRVGISGWSYGGFMTAYALTHSDVFSLGIAGAGVYDWRLYDSIYTERYMDTPQRNGPGYDASSCLRAAADLRGHLLLIHGTMDDNVHLENTIRFLYALEQAGRHFDLMLYPKSRHGVKNPTLGRHLRLLMWKTIREHLAPGGGGRRSRPSRASIGIERGDVAWGAPWWRRSPRSTRIGPAPSGRSGPGI